MNNKYKVVIIGCGVAGMTAGLYFLLVEVIWQ